MRFFLANSLKVFYLSKLKDLLSMDIFTFCFLENGENFLTTYLYLLADPYARI
jgi:hypothetical protein